MIVKRLLFSFFSLWGGLLSIAAQSFSGVVVDSQDQPLQFVSIVLQTADSLFICGCITDELGCFSLQVGESQPKPALLKVSSVSYKTIVMNCNDNIANLRLVMEDDVVEYADVIVKGKRPFTKHVGDKVVFNPQLMNNIEAMQVVDILKYVPGVIVGKDVISYTGKTAVVMVNGRVVGLDYLANLNASDVERIELRTSHSSMYSAEMQGCIINIVTKRFLLGVRGTASMYSSTQFRNIYTLIPRTSVFFGTPKWNVYVNYSFIQSRSKSYSEITNEFLYNNTVHKSNLYDVSGTDKKHSYTVGTVFYVAENHELSFEVNGSLSPTSASVSTADEELTLSDGTKHTAYMTTQNPSKRDFYNVAGSYKWDVDTLGSSLKVLMNYNRIKSQNENQLIATYTNLPANNINEIDAAKADAENISGRVDFEKNWGSGWKITIGGEYLTSKRYSETAFNMLLENTTKMATWNYREHIGGGYLGVEKQWGRIYAVARMRVEHTLLSGYVTENDEVKRNNTDVVPYAFMRYSTDNGWNFSAYYSKTISRPAFSALTGYMERYSDVLYGMGNPDLKHELTDKINLSVDRKGHNFSVEYWFTPDAMVETLHTDNGITYIQKRNEGTRKILFLTYTYGGMILPWWQTDAGVNALYVYYPNGFNLKSNWTGLFNWVNRFSWERIGIFELNTSYMTKYLQANITQEQKTVEIDFSYERNLGKRFIASVGINDILNGGRIHSVHMSPTLIYDIRINSYYPNVWCKLVYKFDNKRKAKTSQLENWNDIRSRMN
ncbi:TonB-dependent receptor [Prevotella sp. E9-3]|uniref:outer membrane beta-barrel family protein n=1 Tax=Prevotella sp. E9-3 TaxID=2913621 RepID=UPI001EDAE87B|nr:outer membrane beta-barrel family protein [Prevotella sp. E9-3]UKK47775.1 TonB-dependent receptor [Prevotella sp. E9-3]